MCINRIGKVEIKAVSALTGEHQAQLIDYLKVTGIQVGLLLNFGRPRIEIKRLVLSAFSASSVVPSSLQP